MNVKPFPWQEDQKVKILSQAKAGVLPHAYLFNGLKGIGKKQFALFLASWLLCDSESKADAPCGNCKQCKLMSAESHGDFRLVEPEDGSKVIKVDAIRSLTEFIGKSANQGGMKIALIAPAEALNINASNALLKTLEEPSDRTLIILVSHVSGQLLPTIRSRCQVVDFAKPSLDIAADWLAGNTDKAKDEVVQLLNMSSGAPLEALGLGEINAVEENEMMLKELGGILKREVSPAVIAERWSDDHAAIRVAWTIQWLESLSKGKFLNDGQETSGSSARMFAYIREKANMESLFQLYDETIKQQSLLLGSSNPNKNLLFEHLFQKWIELIRN